MCRRTPPPPVYISPQYPITAVEWILVHVHIATIAYIGEPRVSRLTIINHLSASHNYIRNIYYILLFQITAFKHDTDKTWRRTARFQNRWHGLCKFWIIFTYWKMWIALVAIEPRNGHNNNIEKRKHFAWSFSCVHTINHELVIRLIRHLGLV